MTARADGKITITKSSDITPKERIGVSFGLAVQPNTKTKDHRTFISVKFIPKK